MLGITARITQKRIETLVKELRYVSSDTFLRGLDLDSDADRVLAYLKRIFPKSRTGSGSQSNRNEFGTALYQGWQVTPIFEGAKAGFDIFHQLEDNDRVGTILQSLDKGSRAYSFVAKEDFTFLGKHAHVTAALRNSKFQWVTIKEGRVIPRPARAGVHYIDRTYSFIQRTMIPALKKKVTDKIRRRLERI